MTIPTKLEGWKPAPGEVSLEKLVDLAFDYRGDTTLVLHDGREVLGYLFNKSPAAAEPFVEVYLKGQADPVRIPYSAIDTIHFSGKDTAA